MDSTIKKLLNEEGKNYILPFFWIHGEEEKILRDCIKAIHDSNIKAFCIESRPHPEFVGYGWWRDLDIILDEAKKRDMKVWILDDAQFPTGYANGMIESSPQDLHREGVCYESYVVACGETINIDIDKFLDKSNELESAFSRIMGGNPKTSMLFERDRLLSITAFRTNSTEHIDLTKIVHDGVLKWEVPKGEWKVGLCKLSNNCGTHKNYINMLSKESCRLLIDAVYEKHYEKYKEEFGKTIIGFFSDEPELGNGPIYNYGNVLGTAQDMPWCHTVVTPLTKKLGASWKNKLYYLWENDLNKDETAKVRVAYMDVITELVKENFSMQIGEWCRSHGVEYIGHIIEDNNQHCRTGMSLGHFFRGMAGQDMAGIDDIGGQVLPQGEDAPDNFMRLIPRDGEFYHYALAKLGSSLAAIDPLKKGRTICEIFGNYGWSAGVRLQKYLVDHFLVRGVNNFVPHAFNAKEYPDSDCPPHFYAHGNNPQYRHFGALMKYTNRVCEIINGGYNETPVAIMYHGESEWSGECMLLQKPARLLTDNQIGFEILPLDIFNNRDYFNVNISENLEVNSKKYSAFIIPYSEYISVELVKVIAEMKNKNMTVIFLEDLPKGCYDGDKECLQDINGCQVLKLEELVPQLINKGLKEVFLRKENNRVRYMHYIKDTDYYLFVNEDDKTYKGEIEIKKNGSFYIYDAWENKVERAKTIVHDGVRKIVVKIEPSHSLIIVYGNEIDVKDLITSNAENASEYIKLNKWERSICRSIDYPAFLEEKVITLPDNLHEEKEEFSGFIRYKTSVELNDYREVELVISDAYEGVEAIVNGCSAGIKVVPSYRFDISKLVHEGENEIVIEVATTLEREQHKNSIFSQMKLNTPSGITGEVNLVIKKRLG